MKLAATLILSALLASTVATAEAPTGLLEVGSAAPAFKLPSQDGSTISLEQFSGQWVVLYFYPKDMTKGCTIEAHNFQRDLAAFEKRKAVVLGVSVDSPRLAQRSSARRKSSRSGSWPIPITRSRRRTAC
jgi:peroxiredoxin Q/BCP